jgi:hypothetical protein
MIYTVVDHSGNYIKSFTYRREALAYLALLEEWKEASSNGLKYYTWVVEEG